MTVPVNTLDIAEKALALRVDSGRSGVSIPSIIGKRVEHWSYKVIAAGAVVGLIIAVVAFIFASIPAGIVGIILLGTNALATFYLHKFRNFNQLEDYVKKMATRIQEFHTQIIDLKRTNTDLGLTVEKFKKIPEDWNKQIEKGKADFEKIKKDFEFLRKRYDAVIEKLMRFSTVAKDLEIQTNRLNKETDRMNQEEDELQLHSDRIAKLLVDLNGEGDELQLETTKLNDVLIELDRLDKEFDVSVDAIKGHLKPVQELYDQMKGLLHDSSALIEQYKVLASTLTERTKIIEEITPFIQLHKTEFDEWKLKFKT